ASRWASAPRPGSADGRPGATPPPDAEVPPREQEEPAAVPADQRRPAARRPIRATAPKSSGTPAWLIALLLLAALVMAYLFLTSS
ncbi:MAG TPA: hypothetical protein VFT28_13430, partial [Gemmatimonadales bacterium]|nr:hypothetical protein [Gemmatimonadales bacterium]